MALEAVLDSLEGVPEALQEFYEEKDGKFKLSVKGVEFPEDVAGLKTALEKEKERRRQLAERLEALPADFDAERWAELTEAEKKRAQKDAEEKGEWEKLKTHLLEENDKKLKAKDTEMGSVVTQLDMLLRENQAREALEKAEASVELMLPHVMGRTKVINEDGARKCVVVDKKGERRYGKGDADKTIGELVAELREVDEFAGGFAGTGSTGGGASGRKGAGGADTVRSKADLKTPEAKSAYIDKHGADAFISLPGT